MKLFGRDHKEKEKGKEESSSSHTPTSAPTSTSVHQHATSVSSSITSALFKKSPDSHATDTVSTASGTGNDIGLLVNYFTQALQDQRRELLAVIQEQRQELADQRKEFLRTITEMKHASHVEHESFLKAIRYQSKEIGKSSINVGLLTNTGSISNPMPLPWSGGGGSVSGSNTGTLTSVNKKIVKPLQALREFEKKGLSNWKCKQHGLCEHDIFINYRVRTDKDIAEKIALYLNGQKKADGSNVSVFLDKYCLQDGEDWEVGFLNGLQGASVIVMLISEDGIAQIRDADKRQDNVLLEYEYALKKSDEGSILVFPMLLGKEEPGGILKKFSAFDTSVYPDARHGSKNSDKNVRETMNHVFKLQGSQTDPSSFAFNMPSLLRVVERAHAPGKESDISPAFAARAKELGKKKLDLDDVQVCLRNADLSEYSQLFYEHKIDGEILLAMLTSPYATQLNVLRKLKDFMEKASESVQPRKDFVKFLRSVQNRAKVSEIWNTLVEGMRKFSKEADLQIEALGVICLLTDEKKEDEENREYIISQGGAELVIETVTNFVNNKNILDTGFNAMANLMNTAKSAAFSETSARVVFVQKGAIPLIVRGMRENISVLPLVKAGIICLGLFAYNPVNAESIVEQGGVAVILEVMEKHSRYPVFDTFGIQALADLSRSVVEVQRVLGEMKVIPFLLKKLSVYGQDPQMKDLIFMAIGRLCEYPSNRLLIEPETIRSVRRDLEESFQDRFCILDKNREALLHCVATFSLANFINSKLFLELQTMNLVLNILHQSVDYHFLPLCLRDLEQNVIDEQKYVYSSEIEATILPLILEMEKKKKSSQRMKDDLKRGAYQVATSASTLGGTIGSLAKKAAEFSKPTRGGRGGSRARGKVSTSLAKLTRKTKIPILEQIEGLDNKNEIPAWYAEGFHQIHPSLDEKFKACQVPKGTRKPRLTKDERAMVKILEKEDKHKLIRAQVAKTVIKDASQLVHIVNSALEAIKSLIGLPEQRAVFLQLRGVELILRTLKRFRPIYSRFPQRRELPDRANSILFSLMNDKEAAAKIIEAQKSDAGLVLFPFQVGVYHCNTCLKLDLPACPTHGPYLATIAEGGLKCAHCPSSTLDNPLLKGGCRWCKSKEIHTQVVKMGLFHVAMLLKGLDLVDEKVPARKDKEGCYQAGFVVCQQCDQMECPADDHGLFSLQIKDHIKCDACTKSTRNTAPWYQGCRFCQSPLYARACLIATDVLPVLKRVEKEAPTLSNFSFSESVVAPAVEEKGEEEVIPEEDEVEVDMETDADGSEGEEGGEGGENSSEGGGGGR